MNKIKNLFNKLNNQSPKCIHKYKFFPQKLNALTIRKIRGVCIHCDKQLELTLEEYRKFLEENKDSVVSEE